MKKSILILTALLVAGGFFAWYQYQKEVLTLERVSADYSMTADELFDAFDSDEAAASERYEQKVIEITGIVVAVTEQEQGANVTLEAPNALMGGVSCGFSEVPEGAQVGEAFTCRCRCQGFLMDVILNNCYAIK